MSTSDDAARTVAAAERLRRIQVDGESPSDVYIDSQGSASDAFKEDLVDVVETYLALQSDLAELEADSKRWDYLRRDFARHTPGVGWDIPRIFIGCEGSSFSEAFDELMARVRLEEPALGQLEEPSQGQLDAPSQGQLDEPSSEQQDD